MTLTWNLTAAELVIAWDRLFAERLPSPLCALLPVHYADEYARLSTRTWVDMRDRYDGSLHDALGRVARADVRVVAHGVDPEHPEDSMARVRVLGARQGPTAVLIRQLPGESMWHSGGFTITMGEAERLAGAIVGAMPACDPGRLPDTPMVASPDHSDTDHWYGRSQVHDSYPDLERRAGAFLNSPVRVLGSIEISQGRSIFGPRGIRTRRIYWRDLVDDGRYVIPDTPDPVAVGADPYRLRALIATDIATVLQTLEDERRA
ncbi:ESX secretion-associated protein EspG [Nocardia miyunensis]|uniref:ESX secretion-associated protein EspG n=1 Tax=Nocardia miyunensis TaxID=282684 RepID=UPI00083375B5|nr:ESX secretion-associated protein EspG [Nocardia miyunensis]